MADLLEADQKFANQYYNYETGKIMRLYGFDVYEYDDTPLYALATLNKVAYGAVAGEGDMQASVAFTTKRMYLPPLSADDQEQNYIRIVMEMLCDPRYNPFEDAPEDGEGNENANYADFLSWAQQAFVPVAIVLYEALRQNSFPGMKMEGEL